MRWRVPAAHRSAKPATQQRHGFLYRSAFIFKWHAAMMQPPHIQPCAGDFPLRRRKIIHQRGVALRKHSTQQGGGGLAARGE
jgi:hypothetical protein